MEKSGEIVEVMRIMKSFFVDYERELRIIENEARAEGKAEGRAEGKAEGRAEGRAEGKAEGRAEGKMEGFIDAIVSLMRNGCSDEQARQLLQATPEQIEKAKSICFAM